MRQREEARQRVTGTVREGRRKASGPGLAAVVTGASLVQTVVRRRHAVYGARVTKVTSRARRSLAALGLALGVLAGVTACGGSSGEASSSASQAPATAAAGSSSLLDAQQLTVLDQQISYPKKKPAQVSSEIISLEPGQETGWRKNNAPTYAYVLEGTLTVEYDAGVTKEFPAGTAFMQAQGVFYNGMNKGDQTLHVLVVSIGAKGVKNTVKRAS